jgi:hypothetical protein
MNQQPGEERERTPKARAAPTKKPNGAGTSGPALAEELATLFPAARTVTIAGRTVEIKPCGIAQAGRIIDAGMPLYALHVERGAELLSFIEEEPGAINALIVAATGFDAEWVTSLQPMDKIDLINEWLEVNGGFFFRRLVPRLARFGTAIAGILGAGRTSSTS